MLQRMRALLPGSRSRTLSTTSPAKNPACAEFDVDNWAVSRFVLANLIPAVGVEPFPLHELMLMSAAVCRLRPPQIFEWGTHVGKSARVFYECTRHYGIAVSAVASVIPARAFCCTTRSTSQAGRATTWGRTVPSRRCCARIRAVTGESTPDLGFRG